MKILCENVYGIELLKISEITIIWIQTCGRHFTNYFNKQGLLRDAER